MKKKPPFLRLKQKLHNAGRLINHVLSILTFNRKSILWCKIGLHKDIPTYFSDFKCARCGRWMECH